MVAEAVRRVSIQSSCCIQSAGLRMLVLFLVCLLLSYGVSTNVNNSILTSDERTLVWFPSADGGLFSHFFQLRYINSVAQKYKRKLVIAPHTSIHASDDKNVVMCDVLNLPDMVCVNDVKVNKRDCANDLDLEPFGADTQVCFNGHNIWGEISLFDVMKLGPPLIYQEPYRHLYRRVYASFIKDLYARSKSITYMIIHWRRGDQLTTRCTPNWKGSKDTSLNCQTAAALIAHVKQFMRTSFDGTYYNTSNIFVATNEQNTTILNHLRAHNFIPISDMFKVHYDGAFGNMSSLDEFVLETQFMLNAPMFVSFGISQINDVIESERMALGSSFCLMSEEEYHKSWCEGARKGKHLEKGTQIGGRYKRVSNKENSNSGNNDRASGGAAGGVQRTNPGEGSAVVRSGNRVKPSPPVSPAQEKQQQRAANKARNQQMIEKARGQGTAAAGGSPPLTFNSKFRNRDSGGEILIKSNPLRGHNNNNP